ncbi:MAG: O-antigen ligase family protein, partial [Clostridia bacterium]|nr:O-antigen ligase family protein [Clostridia bacterium]
ALAVGPLVIIIYLFFINGIRPPKNFDVPLYVCINFIAATIVGCMELLLVFLTKDENFLINVRNLGWGNFNTLGAMTLIAIPACCYVIVKTGKSACTFAVIALFIVADLLSGSDGSLGIAVFSVPFLTVFTFFRLKKKDRKEFMICLFIVLTALCVAAIAIINELGLEEILSYTAFRAKDNGRIKLYSKALELFRANPLLGVGQGFRDESVYVPATGSLQTFNFHSTLFHVIATMGVLGIIAYAFYYFFRIKILLGRNAAFNAFAFLSFVLLQAYGLIDTCEFNVIPLMAYATLLILCVELYNEKKGKDDVFPLLFANKVFLSDNFYSL